jgi:hypothetical protein
VIVDGYPFADLQPIVPGSLFDERVLDAGGHLEVGYLDDEPVTVGARHVAHGLVVLTLGEQARHRGCWAAMVRLEPYPDLPAAALFSDDSRPGAEGRSGSSRSPGSPSGSGTAKFPGERNLRVVAAPQARADGPAQVLAQLGMHPGDPPDRGPDPPRHRGA